MRNPARAMAGAALAMVLGFAVTGCASTIPHAQKSTEHAWIASLKQGRSDAPCHAVIGRKQAAALVRYCRWWSKASNPPCNSQNACAVITDYIATSCGAGDAASLPATLPCERYMTTRWWNAAEQLPAK
jgi:hypothetical protein